MRGLSVAGGLVVLALAGCSAHVHVGGTVGNGVTTLSSTTSSAATLDSTKMASVVERLTQQRGLQADTVSCPSNIPERSGYVVTCVAYYEGGHTGNFRVLQKDSEGDIHVSAAEMIAPEVTDDIYNHLPPAHSSTVSCPQHVPIVVGNTFNCTAQRKGQTVTILVKIIDPDGGFHWSVVR